jgi:hypothetical protein
MPVLKNIDWLIHCPVLPPNPQMGQMDWNWNYAADLKSKGWTGVWENFCRLYAFWRHIVLRSDGGLGDSLTKLHQRKVIAEADFERIRHVDYWGPTRRNKVERTPAFFDWLLTVGKPMDSEILAWFPLTIPDVPPRWDTTYGNPRALPETSMYVVAGGRNFSNQRSTDGPFVMSIHSRGYKKAVIQYIAPKNNKQVVQEYAKQKQTPFAWEDALPYASTPIPQRYPQYNFTPNDLRLGLQQWHNQLSNNRATQSTVRWSNLRIRPAAPPLYLSIEPQDLGAVGSKYRSFDYQSINHSSISLKV